MGAVTLGYDENGRRIRKTVSAATKTGVLERLRAVQRQVSDGLPVPDDRVTVSELLDRWQNDVLRHQVAESAYMNYVAIGDHHIRPALGSIRLTKLTPSDVDALLSRKLDDGYSVSTVRRIRAVLAQALAQGERWGLVVRNVAAVTRGPRDRRRQGRTLTPAQAQTLLAALKGDHYEALFTTMLALGLRRGEALGLRWADINLEKGTLTVRAGAPSQCNDGRTPRRASGAERACAGVAPR
jgi:integrase